MNKNRALKGLNYQKDKLLDTKYFKDAIWVFQTASWIQDIFGKDSPEYAYIGKFSFVYEHLSGESDEQVRRGLDRRKKDAEKFIDSCIQTVKLKGVIYQPKVNFLQKFNNIQMFGTLLGIAAIIFSIGIWVGYTNARLASFEKSYNISNSDTASKHK